MSMQRPFGSDVRAEPASTELHLGFRRRTSEEHGMAA